MADKRRTRCQRNNNPINLEYKAQKESVGSDGRFAVFPTPEAGWRAAHRQIARDQDRGLRLDQFIFKFAPPGENNTNAYLEFVCKELNVSALADLKDVSKYALAGVMAAYEGYYK